MPRLQISEASIDYLDAGSNDAILLLHAFPLHAEMWLPQLEALADSYRIVAPSARGLGRSTPAPPALTMEMIADDAAALLDELGIERAVVGGLSMGGYAAFAFWRRHRSRVQALLLADTRPTADSDDGRADRERFARAALERGSEWVADEMVPKLQRNSPVPRVAEELRRLIQQNDPAGVAAAQRGMALRPDSTSLLPSINCPVLVLVGDEDTLTTPAVARAMAAPMPNATVTVIPGAGHATNLEAPEAFNAALAGFLQDSLGSARE